MTTVIINKIGTYRELSRKNARSARRTHETCSDLDHYAYHKPQQNIATN